MSSFTPKTYQSQVLESITTYFESCHEQRSPSLAFTATTEQLWGRGLAYNPLSGFPFDMLARFRPASVMDLTATPDVDRLIGGLWAALSQGRCRFVMVREKCWEAIDALLP
jgi:hypothetical protein